MKPCAGERVKSSNFVGSSPAAVSNCTVGAKCQDVVFAGSTIVLRHGLAPRFPPGEEMH
jgi:hypothetical protein